MNKNDISTPIENVIGYDAYITDYMDLCGKNRPPVQSHKTKLGKQNYCYNNGEFRLWVWERNNWRVYVGNQKGICFEVLGGISKQEAIEAWNDYMERMTK